LFMQDKHELAYSYLLTIGAKALVLSEEESVPSNTLKNGLTNESKSSRQIRLDEITRLQQKRLRNGVGILVTKRGRNNESMRKLYLKVKAFAGADGEFLVWTSNWTGIRKKFALNDLVKAEFMGEPDKSEAIDTTAKSSALPPFMRLTGRLRYIDLQFANRVEADAFLVFCKEIIARNSRRNIS
jgi:hypothetical protein